MNNNIDYKYKALKYKAKYLELKKKIDAMNIKGGVTPDWYPQFESELYDIYNKVSNIYPDVILTGSAVIAYLLKNLDLEDEFLNFKPNDLDFLYKSNISEHNPNKIDDYEIKPEQKTASSVTFILHPDLIESKYIKSFDISKTNPKTKSFNFNGINFINLNTLISDYKPDFGTPEERIKIDEYKIELINKIIDKIKRDNRLNEFGLENHINIFQPKGKSLFDESDIDSDNDSDDDNMFINSPSKKLKLSNGDDDNTDDFISRLI